MPLSHELDHCDPLDSRQFLVAVRKLADSLSYGTDHSPFRGSGIEYVQSRGYMPGDPIKSIDWRVTARTGKLFVKEYEAPKQMPAYLLIDTSASMTVSSTPISKYAWATQIAGGIGLACLDRVSPVGVLGCGGSDLNVRPSLSKQRVLEWLHQLRHFRTDEPTTLGRRTVELGPSLPSRSLIIAISDLHDPEAVPALKLLAQRHDVAAIQLRDPAEDGLTGAGIFRAREAESGTSFTATGRSKGWLDQDKIEEELRRGGVDHLLLHTDGPIAHPLRRFLESRNVLGRGAR